MISISDGYSSIYNHEVTKLHFAQPTPVTILPTQTSPLEYKPYPYPYPPHPTLLLPPTDINAQRRRTVRAGPVTPQHYISPPPALPQLFISHQPPRILLPPYYFSTSLLPSATCSIHS
ncbi:hypothetical protein P154DRAFT_144413 [Amniculicola lignicola CBS 123094]|uniref:Uncharacterized protein n=1 Tax=Amniculicola lignicola CBS 123094 TaxID=1392246 RepID=A0A6A5WND3_9PLEO|nr:hypothetical protein P154DRAFT_144413 [Amniculicola lignicola CBS 123094]